MQRLQAFKFELMPRGEQVRDMRRFAGACRKVFNDALDLQQSLKDLDKAYQNFFEGRASFPNFKKRGERDSLRFPQGFEIDQANSRIKLPKLGWIRYRNSRAILGTPKNITISQSGGKWFASIQTEREVEQPVPTATSAIGIDVGIARLAVPPQYTSQTCPCCGHVAKANRQTQAKFECVDCGYENNADVVGAMNILARGYRAAACGEDVRHAKVARPKRASSKKQEPPEATLVSSNVGKSAVGIPFL